MKEHSENIQIAIHNATKIALDRAEQSGFNVAQMDISYRQHNPYSDCSPGSVLVKLTCKALFSLKTNNL